MTAHPMIRRRAACALLLLLTTGAAGCVENAAETRPEPQRAPEPLGWELTPEQAELMRQPVSPEAAARPATAAEVEKARRESVAVITAVNRYRRDRGADTLPHCLPQCGAQAPATESTPP